MANIKSAKKRILVNDKKGVGDKVGTAEYQG